MSWTLSEFLNLLELRGRSWSIVDIRSQGGLSIPASDSVCFYGLLQGAARIAGVDNEVLELSPGDVRIVLSGRAHAIRSQADSPTTALAFIRDPRDVDTPPILTVGEGPRVGARLLCGMLKANWPGGLRRMSLPPYVKLDATSLGSSTSAIRLQTLQSASTGNGAAALLTRIAAMMLTIALRDHPDCPALFRSSGARDPIERAVYLIDSDPTADWSVASLAHKVGMGRSNFAARFAQEIGRTPMDVIAEKRMQYAASLLTDGELKIAEVSLRAGYKSEAAFSRRFVRVYGVPPGQMRHRTAHAA